MDVLRVSIAEASDCYLVGELPSGETVRVTTFYDMDGASSPVISDDVATEYGTTGLYYWSLSNLSAAPSAAMSILWVMTSTTTSRTTWGVLYIGGYPEGIKDANVALTTIDGIVDDILTDTGTTLPASIDALPTAVEIRTEIDANSTQLADIIADTEVIGTGVALDGGPATLAGMLTKMADDSAGAAFDATTDSMQAIADGESTAPTVTQIREEMDANSTKLASILEDTGITIPAALTTIDGVVDDVLVDTNDIVNKMESGSLPPNRYSTNNGGNPMKLFGKKDSTDAAGLHEETTTAPEKPQEPRGGTIDQYVGYSVIVRHTRTPGPLHEVYVLETAPVAPIVHVKFSTRKFPVWDDISAFTVVDVIGTEERDFYNSIRSGAVKKEVKK